MAAANGTVTVTVASRRLLAMLAAVVFQNDGHRIWCMLCTSFGLDSIKYFVKVAGQHMQHIMAAGHGTIICDLQICRN